MPPLDGVPGDPNDVSKRNLWDAAVSFLAAIVATAVNGYHFTNSDIVNYFQVLAAKTLNPQLFPGDPFLEALKSYLTYYATLVTWLIRLLGEGGLPWAAFLLSLLTTAAFYRVVFRIGESLFDRTTGYLAVVLLLANKQIMGFSYLYSFGFEKRSLGLVLGLYALLFFIENRPILACAVAGLAVNVHPIYGGIVFLLFGMVALAARGERPLRTLAQGFAVFVLCAAPMIWWVLQHNVAPLTSGPLGFFAPSDAPFLEINALRNKHFIDPIFGWGKDKLAFLGLYLFGLAYYGLSGARPRFPERHRETLRLLAAFGVLLILATLFTYVLPNIYVMHLLVFRVTAFIAVFSLVYFAAAAAHNWKVGGRTERVMAAVFFTVLALLEIMFHPYTAFWLALGLVLISVGLRRLRGWVPPDVDDKRLIVAVGAVAAMNLILVWHTVGRDPRFGLAIDALPRDWVWFFNWGTVFLMAWALLAGLVLARDASRAFPRAATLWLAGIILNVACAYSVPILGHRRGMSPAFFSNYDLPGRAASDWRKLQDFARENTDIGDVFITPWEITGFRAYSHRSPVVEFSDGSGAILDRDFAFAWWERMAAIGGTPPSAQEKAYYQADMGYWLWKGTHRYRGMGARELAEVGARYNAKYVVVHANGEVALPFPVRYQNDKFVLHEIPPTTSTVRTLPSRGKPRRV